MKPFFVLICYLLLLNNGWAQYPMPKNSSLLIMRMNGKVGLVKNSFPNIVVPPVYDEMTWTTEKLLSVKTGPYCGLVDTLGSEKVKPDRYTAFRLLEDPITRRNSIYLSTHDSEHKLLLDEHGNSIASNFYQVYSKLGGVLVVSVTSEDSTQRKLYFANGGKNNGVKFGLLSSNGAWLVKPSNRRMSVANNCCFVFEENDEPYPNQKLTLYNLQGKNIINDTLTNFCYDHFINDSLLQLKQFCVQNDIYNWIVDSMGKVISKQKRPDSNLKCVFDPKTKRYGGQLNNQWVIPPIYKFLHTSYRYAFAYDSVTNATHVYLKNGELLKKTHYEHIYSLNMIRPCKEINPIKEQLIGQNSHGHFLLNEKFEPISKPVGSFSSQTFCNNYSSLFTFMSPEHNYGLMNGKGEVVVEPVYKRHAFEKIGLVWVPVDYDMHDIFTLDGQLIQHEMNDAKRSTVNANMCYVKRMGLEGVYSITDAKEIIRPGIYNQFVEVKSYSIVLASKHDSVFVLDNNFNRLSQEVFNKTALSSNYPILTAPNGKKLLIDTVDHKLSKPYDAIYPGQGTGFQVKYLVTRSGKYGLVDIHGKELVPCKWDTLYLAEKRAIARLQKKFFVSNNNFRFSRRNVADTVQSFQWGSANLYKTNKTWQSLQFPDAVVDGDQILNYSYNHRLEVRKDAKYGLYSLPQKKWLAEPVFDSLVHDHSRYNYPVPVCFTKMHGKHYLIDTVTSKVKEPGFDFIELMRLMTDSHKPQSTNLLVNNGGKKSASTIESLYTNTVTGGKSGILNSKGEWLHAMNGDNVVTLVNKNYINYYYEEDSEEHVLGFLWNIGGTAEEYSHMDDSTTQDVFDEKGNMYTVMVPHAKWYDKKITGGKFGIVGPDGRELLPVIYDKIIFMYYSRDKQKYYRKDYSESAYCYLYDDLALFPVFIKKDNKWGAADLTGKLLLGSEYDSIADCTLEGERMLKVWKNGNFGLFDLFGNCILPCEFSGELNEYYTSEESTIGRFYLTRKGGSEKVYFSIKRVEQEIFLQTGELITKMVNDTTRFYYYQGSQLGIFLPGKPNTSLPAEYEDIRFLQQVTDSNENIHIIRLSLTQKTDMKPRLESSHADPYFEIKKAGKWGIYNVTKGIIIPPQYQDIEVLAVIEERLRSGFDPYNTPAAEEKVGQVLGFKFKQAGKWGVLDTNGTQLIKPEFDEITITSEGYYKVVKTGRHALYDSAGKTAR